MKRTVFVTALVLLALAPALQARAMMLCMDDVIQINIHTMRGVALVGTAGPMPCDGGQIAMVTGMYRDTGEELIFSLFFDQAPSESCIEGWTTMGFFADGVGTGYWFNTTEFPIYGPVTLRRGPCNAAARTDFLLDPLAPVPGVR